MSSFAEIGMSVGKEKVVGCILITRPDSVFFKFRVILMT